MRGRLGLFIRLGDNQVGSSYWVVVRHCSGSQVLRCGMIRSGHVVYQSGPAAWHGQTENDELAAQYMYDPDTYHTRCTVPNWTGASLSEVVGTSVRAQPGAATWLDNMPAHKLEAASSSQTFRLLVVGDVTMARGWHACQLSHQGKHSTIYTTMVNPNNLAIKYALSLS